MDPSQCLFLTTGGWKPESADNDTVSLLVDGSILVDTGWHCVASLLRHGVPVENVRTLLFTHMHQDHYLSLPSLLFYLLNSHRDAGTLTIYGPAGVEEICEAALRFAGKDIHYRDCPGPRVVRLSPGDSLSLGRIGVRTAAALHPVPALSYRFTHGESGKSIVYSGDTMPSENLTALAAGCDALIHENSLGPSVGADFDNGCMHSTALDAAGTAQAAGAGALYLVHSGQRNRAGSLETAQRHFSGPVYWPDPGCRILLRE